MIPIKLKKNELVAIKHYSHKYPFKTIVLDFNIEQELITILLVKEFASSDIMLSDPIVIIHEHNSLINIIGGFVNNISLSDKSITIKFDNIKEQKQKREEERLSVSIYADAKSEETGKNALVIVKDISRNGLLIVTKHAFIKNEILRLSLHTEERVIFLKTTVTRVNQNQAIFSYGLYINYEDTPTIAYMKDYINYVKKENIDAISRIKNLLK